MRQSITTSQAAW